MIPYLYFFHIGLICSAGSNLTWKSDIPAVGTQEHFTAVHPGYAMRGGKIFVKGNAGYRAGIHMKAYEEKKPVMVIGGTAGSFLGEYQAGGVIVVLGLGAN
mgnify:CR=1 FL=1